MDHDPTLQRRFLRLALLNVLATIAEPLASLIDAAMLGHLPDIHFLAGVALGAIVFDYVYWTLGFLRMSTTGLTAQAIGRNDSTEVELLLRRSLLLAMAMAAAILIVHRPLADLAFAILSGAADAEAAGRAYYEARIWGAPAALMNLVFLGWFLGRAEGRLIVLMTATGALANIALNYVFILRLGLAARGAGIGTMVSQYLVLTVASAFYWLRKSDRPPPWRQIFDRRQMAALLGLQLDILIRTLCLVSSFAVFTNLSAGLGNIMLAANHLLLRLLNLGAYLTDGAAYATESFAGRVHGRRDSGELRRLLRLALTTGLSFAIAFALPLVVAPRLVLRLLTTHEEVIAMAGNYLGWMLATLIIGSAAYIYDGYFLGLTAGRTLRNAMLLSTLGVFAPLAWLAQHRHSAELLWLSLLAFMIARATTLAWAARRAAVIV